MTMVCQKNLIKRLMRAFQVVRPAWRARRLIQNRCRPALLLSQWYHPLRHAVAALDNKWRRAA